MNDNYLFTNWQTTDSEAKALLLNEIINHLGNDWEIDGEQLLHTPSEKRFAFIPGGWMVQGLSVQKLLNLFSIYRYYDFESSTWNDEIIKMRPSKQVWVYPFLISVDSEINDEEAIKKTSQFSLPSETEIEWIFSNGGELDFVAEDINRKKKTSFKFIQPFGIPDIQYKQIQCIDDWHETLHDKPSDSLPWGTGKETTKYAHLEWQDEEEILGWHVACRHNEEAVDVFDVVRLNDLFPEKETAPSIDNTSFISEIIENSKATQKTALLNTIMALGITPANDTEEVINEVFNHFDKQPKFQSKLLEAFAIVLINGNIEKRLNTTTNKFAQIIEKHIDTFTSLIKVEAPKKLKLVIIDILSYLNSPCVFESLSKLYKTEKNKEVLYNLNLAAALYIKRKGEQQLLFEHIENKKDKPKEYIKTLFKNIAYGADPEEIIATIKGGEIEDAHLPWFINLLKTAECSDEKKLAFQLLDLCQYCMGTSPNQGTITQIIKVAFPLVFPETNTMLSKKELNDVQKTFLSQIIPMDKYIDKWEVQREVFRKGGIYDSLFGKKVQLGISNSIYEKLVDFKGTKTTLYTATLTFEDRYRKEYQKEEEFQYRYINGDTFFFTELADLYSQLEFDEIIKAFILHKTGGKKGIQYEWPESMQIIMYRDKQQFVEYLKPLCEDIFNKKDTSDGYIFNNAELHEEELNDPDWYNFKRRSKILAMMVMLLEGDTDLQKWFFNNISLANFDCFSETPKNEIQKVSSEIIYDFINKRGEKIVSELQKDREQNRILSSPQEFIEYITPDTDPRIVAGILAFELWNNSLYLYDRINHDKSLNKFKNLIPENYFEESFCGKYSKEYNYLSEYIDVPKSFEKLWRAFLGDNSFKI